GNAAPTAASGGIVSAEQATCTVPSAARNGVSRVESAAEVSAQISEPGYGSMPDRWARSASSAYRSLRQTAVRSTDDCERCARDDVQQVSGDTRRAIGTLGSSTPRHCSSTT